MVQDPPLGRVLGELALGAQVTLSLSSGTVSRGSCLEWPLNTLGCRSGKELGLEIPGLWGWISEFAMPS